MVRSRTIVIVTNIVWFALFMACWSVPGAEEHPQPAVQQPARQQAVVPPPPPPPPAKVTVSSPSTTRGSGEDEQSSPSAGFTSSSSSSSSRKGGKRGGAYAGTHPPIPLLDLPPVAAPTGPVEPAVCPDDDVWLQAWRKTAEATKPPTAISNRPVLMVDVGSSKGYTLGRWIRAVAGRGAVNAQGATASDLAVDLIKFAALNGVERFCGSCCACFPPFPAVANKSSVAADGETKSLSNVIMVSFEPHKFNQRSVASFFALARNKISNVVVDSVHRGVSSEVGVSAFPVGVRGGEDQKMVEKIQKTMSSGDAKRLGHGNKERNKVYVTTLDTYFSTTYGSLHSGGKQELAGAVAAAGDDAAAGGAAGGDSPATSTPQPTALPEAGSLTNVFMDVLQLNTPESDVEILRGSRRLLTEKRIGVLLVTLPAGKAQPPAELYGNAMKLKMLQRLVKGYGFKCFVPLQMSSSGSSSEGSSAPFLDAESLIADINAEADELKAKDSAGFSLEGRLPLLCVQSSANPTLVKALSALTEKGRPRPHYEVQTDMCPVESYVAEHSGKHHTNVRISSRHGASSWQKRKGKSKAIQDWFDHNGDRDAVLAAALATPAPHHTEAAVTPAPQENSNEKQSSDNVL